MNDQVEYLQTLIQAAKLSLNVPTMEECTQKSPIDMEYQPLTLSESSNETLADSRLEDHKQQRRHLMLQPGILKQSKTSHSFADRELPSPLCPGRDLRKVDVPFGNEYGPEFEYENVMIETNPVTVPKDAVCIFDADGYEMTAHHILFESRFESGNLWKTYYSCTTDEYYLIIRPDTGTIGYFQWFLFQVLNLSKETIIRINIMNISKKGGLYNQGNRIWIHDHEWQKSGKLSLAPTWKGIEKYGIKWRKEYYSVSLDLSVRKRVFVATWVPYTYSHLQKFIRRIEDSAHVRCKVIGRSAYGNHLDMITVSETASKLANLQDRQGIVILGRVHPGESMSSYIVQSIVEYLMSNYPEAKYLRERFVFKIVPMVNPDGVIAGNHRTNANGYDLNRHYNLDVNESSSEIYKACPELVNVKNLLYRIRDERGIAFMGDLHGHNRFSIVQSKRSTARGVLFEEFGVNYSYCIEASFMGGNGSYHGSKDMVAFGKDFVRGLYELFTQSNEQLVVPVDAFNDESDEEDTSDDEQVNKMVPVKKKKSTRKKKHSTKKTQKEELIVEPEPEEKKPKAKPRRKLPMVRPKTPAVGARRPLTSKTLEFKFHKPAVD